MVLSTWKELWIFPPSLSFLLLTIFQIKLFYKNAFVHRFFQAISGDRTYELNCVSQGVCLVLIYIGRGWFLLFSRTWMTYQVPLLLRLASTSPLIQTIFVHQLHHAVELLGVAFNHLLELNLHDIRLDIHSLIKDVVIEPEFVFQTAALHSVVVDDALLLVTYSYVLGFACALSSDFILMRRRLYLHKVVITAVLRLLFQVLFRLVCPGRSHW